MYLSHVEIKNFRSFKDFSIDLHSGLNVIVGRNNVGKTNLLHAIRHALGPSASHGDALWLERDDFFRKSPNNKREETINITLTFDKLSEKERAFFFEIIDFNLADIAKSRAYIHFQASWPENRRHPYIKRTGGSLSVDAPEVPSSIIEHLPITYLPALRDAETCLAPGVRSRLARLLEDLADQKKDDQKNKIENIFRQANVELEKQPLISDTKDHLQSTTRLLAGTDYFSSAIRPSEMDFNKILRSLQVQMDGAPIASLDANGLGYNNLLYMAVVLEHLKADELDESPLLLVEEPEAHLHPQLTILLAEYLATNTPGKNSPQTIVTTHSPTFAASIPPSQIHVIFTDKAIQAPICNSISAGKMSPDEEGELHRMMDITRATLYFSKAAILVEGISEAILIPVLAKRLNLDLNRRHISVIPICGVAFETFHKLLNTSVLGIPVAIVTDADPPIKRGITWDQDLPESEGVRFKYSDRTKKLLQLFDKHESVCVFASKLTLEYDLAEASIINAELMAQVWETCFIRTPLTFNTEKIRNAGLNKQDRALVTWRGICRSEHTGSKAKFAHRLAAFLSEKDDYDNYKHPFDVPGYLKLAINYVVENVMSS